MVFLIVAVFATTYANFVQTSETISSDVNKLLKLQQLMQNGIGQSSLVEKMLRRKRQIDDIDDSRIGLRTEQMMNHIKNNEIGVSDVFSNFDMGFSGGSRNPDKLVRISEYVSREHLSQDNFKPTVNILIDCKCFIKVFSVILKFLLPNWRRILKTLFCP